MDFVEWAIGFGTFVGVSLALTLGLEALSPGLGVNPFVGVVIGAVAGWGVTTLFGE